MAEKKINDYLVDYHFGDLEKLHSFHFTLDEIVALAKTKATIVRIESIKNPPYRPIDVTEETMKFVKERIKNAKR